MTSEITESISKLSISSGYEPVVITPSYSGGKFTVELSIKELNYISAALDAKYKTMVVARKKSAAEAVARREAKLASGGKVTAARSSSFYAVILDSKNL